MNDLQRFHFDRHAVARSFDRASDRYAAAANLQRDVNTELLERLQFFRLEPRVIVDLGCGTGVGATALRSRFPRAQVIAVDFAFGMTQAALRRQRFWRRYSCVCADGCALPFAAQSVDLVFSNLMLQWCDDPPALFSQVRQVLRPGGLMLFSTFGPDTLHELRTAWASGDTRSHVSAFADMPQLGTAMTRAGLVEPVMDREVRLRHYADVHLLMAELRAVGSRHAATDRRRTLTGRGRIRAMLDAYESVRTPMGLPASWELIYGATFAPAHGPGTDGARETLVPVKSVLARSGRRP